MLPDHSRAVAFLVMILITPASALEPYSEDIGPRITSIRSMADIGGSQPNWVALPKPL